LARHVAPVPQLTQAPPPSPQVVRDSP
jgi:hypothetical protein